MLVEANPSNFLKLERSSRRVHKVHSASGKCSEGNVTVASTGGGDIAGLQQVAKGFPFHVKSCHGRSCVKVPCASLLAISQEALRQHGITYLSLDVEGAEEFVFEAIREALPSFPIDVMLVEASTINDVAKRESAKVRALLNGSGYIRQFMPTGFGIHAYSENDVWVAPWLVTLGSQQVIDAQSKGSVGVAALGPNPLKNLMQMRKRSGAAVRLRNTTIAGLMLPDELMLGCC